MPSTKTPWFPAKRYGWGWGLPSTWHGWLVIALFTSLLVAGAAFMLPRYGHIAFVAYSALLCALLVVVCWIKGEPPRWRWGDK
jgi:hypothetical protein